MSKEMMRLVPVVIVLSLMISTVQAFFIPLTTEQRVAASSVIAVIKVKKARQDQEFGLKSFSEATVIDSLLGARAGETIKVWDDIEIGEDGKEYATAGRDAYLEPGKTYFIYLKKNIQGRLVTVQSSLDSLEVTGDQVEREGEEGSEPLARKMKRTRELVAKIGKVRQNGADQTALVSEAKAEIEGEPESEPEVSPQ